jgi:hypothetical protein
VKQKLALSLTILAGLWCAPGQAPISDAEQEQFLMKARIVKMEEIGHGVTKPRRATLSDGKLTHDAQIQTVNKRLPDFFGGGTTPYPAHDSYKYNIAAYKVDRLMGLNMVPVSAPRTVEGVAGALMWWVDNVAMEEIDRVKKDVKAPDPEAFDRQMAVGRVFDELIINIDRNLANLLITKDWKVALIDSTRSFTAYPKIRNPDKLTRCSRGMIAGMKKLTQQNVAQAVGSNLTAAEITALLARRDLIVAYFEKLAAEKGENQVYF